jgi:hypothetical protein
MADLSGGSRPATQARLATAVLTPLVGVALAYGLWWISDRLLYNGPLDRAQFGWLVVVPVWSLTPVAAAHAWRTLNSGQSTVAAGVVGLLLTVASAVLFWAGEWVIPSVIVGLAVGAGFAAACLGATAVAKRARWWAVLLVGAGSAFALVFVAILVAAPFLMSGGCQRPL